MKRQALNLLLHPLSLLALLLILWEAIAQLHWVNPMLLPPASKVILVLVDLLQRQVVWQGIGVTAYETAISFLIAVPVGMGIGLFLAENRYWGTVFKPFFYFLFSIPKSVFLPMFILALGIGFTQKIAFGVFSTLFITVISISTAIESVDSNHKLVARCYGASRRQIALHVYLPSMLPAILETVRLAMIFNFTGIMLAEMYVSRVGIGHMIGRWGEDYLLPQLLAGVLIVSCAAVLFNESVRLFEKKYGHWRSGQ
jgi:NitT/TauT family transport system permease protein